eukprot:m.434572 g.434572  ORF g.434572 m.434572 type:complete len:286 (-) comp17734_c0_seq1:255-1112(-)
MPAAEPAAAAGVSKPPPGLAIKEDVPKKTFDWSETMAESDSEDDEEAYQKEIAEEKAKLEEALWSGPRVEAGTLEELEELMEQQGYKDETDTEDESEQSEEDEESLSLKLVAPPVVEKAEPVKQLSKKEKKKLEDEAFERELAEALAAAGTAPPPAQPAPPAAAAAAQPEGEGSKKKKNKKKKKKGGYAGGGDAAAPKEVAEEAPVEIKVKSEEEIAKAKAALAAKMNAAANKKATERRKANEKLKALEKKKAEKKKKEQAFAKSGPDGWKFSSDNGVGADGRGG